MTSQTAVHVRNLESSLLFMQQEHANTLKGLHEEIEKLQKRCKELTFQLAMQGLEVGDDGEVIDKHKDLKLEIEKNKERELQLQAQIEKRDVAIKKLEKELKYQKRKILDENRDQIQTMNALRAELEAKSHTVAFLTTELHKLKMQQTAQPILKENSASAIPHPPAESSAKSKRASHFRRSIPVTNKMELEKRPLRVTSGKSGSGGSSRSDSPSDYPDVTPFLKRDGHDPSYKIKPVQTNPLPPITDKSPMEGENTRMYIRNVVQPKQLLMPRKHPSKTSEIPTLAVDQVSDSKVWGHVQESRSSDYN